MPSNQLALDAQGATHAAHLVLEQGAQRLHDLQVHLLGQAAHVVVRLDLAARPVDAHALDDIRIDGALGQPTSALDFLCLCVEHVDEGRTDSLAFGLRVGDTFQLFEEQSA